ncbi:hypothetical protein EMCRGX_G011983 [Ephydatia muelleri]
MRITQPRAAVSQLSKRSRKRRVNEMSSTRAVLSAESSAVVFETELKSLDRKEKERLLKSAGITKGCTKMNFVIIIYATLFITCGVSSVPEHSFIVVEQLISQDILGLQQQGLVLDFTTSPVSDTVARQSCDNTCEHNTCTSTTTRSRSTAAAVNMESRAREESKGPSTFQKLMDVVMRGLPFVTNYSDDILIHSEYKESFQRLKASLTEASVLAYPQTGQHHDTAQQSTCPQFVLTTCSGSYITYTCVLSSSATLGVVTVWSGSAFQCPPTNQIPLAQRAGGTVQPFIPRSCGRLSAVTTNVTSTCYTSVLTIPAVQALNGTTVVCQDGNTRAVVGSGTVNLRMPASPGPVGNIAVTSTAVDQLTVTWTPPTTGGVPTSYNVTINDSSSPVVIADNGSPVYTHTFTGLPAMQYNTIEEHEQLRTILMQVVYNISTTRGTEVTVSLQGLTSGQMYYCTAAGTDANSSSCGGAVVGGVESFFNISAADSICSQLSFHSWYMDDGVIAGPKQAALQALSIIKQLGPPLGLFINTSKCELFSKGGHRGFPDEMKKSNALIFEILGVPIGDPIFCARSIAKKRANASKFLALLKEVGSVHSQVALLLLLQCGGFCQIVHIARCTPPSVALEGLHLFDEEVRQTFSDSMCIDPSDLVWQQAQLSLSRGGLGLCSAPLHLSAAFRSSFSMLGFATNTSHHLLQSLDHFNACVSSAEVISFDELLDSSMTQKMLSTNIENKQFQLLFDASSIPNRALSASSNLAASWLSVIPSPGLNLHLDTAEFQTALKCG